MLVAAFSPTITLVWGQPPLAPNLSGFPLACEQEQE